MDFMAQPDIYTCGPTAIANALIWAGHEVSKEQFEKLKFSCRTIDPLAPTSYEANGTCDHDLDRVLRWAGRGIYGVKRNRKIDIQSLRKHLRNGGIVCLGYFLEHEEKIDGHYVLLTEVSGSDWTVINDYDGKMKRKTQTIKKWLNSSTEDHGVVTWLITRSSCNE